MRDRIFRGLWHVMTAAPVVLWAARVWACPTCKDAIASDPVGTALSATTLLMIAVPLLLFGSLGGWVAYVYWRAAHPEPITLRRAAHLWRPLWTEKESET